MEKLTERGRHWQGIIGEHAARGIPIQAFCAKRSIAEAGFYWWRRELNGLGPPTQGSGKRARPVDSIPRPDNCRSSALRYISPS
jgi:hypothetical protein